MSQRITEDWMRNQIIISNRQAAINRNVYPIQEQATQIDLWEQVPCTCDESCTCKKFGCTHHWKLKSNIRFDDFLYGFLRTFVDRYHHRSILNALDGKNTADLSTRAVGAFSTLCSLRENWDEISAQAADHNKTLFCDDWMNDFFKELWSFSLYESIYKAKQYCILFPDICVPYDTASREILVERFPLNVYTYSNLLMELRMAFLNCMKNHHMTLSSLRSLDSPQDQLPYNKTMISLPIPGMDYGTGYFPKERQISFVLDKCFYQPKTSSYAATTPRARFTSMKVIPKQSYEILPLSGNGKTIKVFQGTTGREVEWGNTKFSVSDEIIQNVLDGFFVHHNQWYLLGASMTDPDSRGLGFFISKNYPTLTPRHASAIAAIMVHEGFLESCGVKPIKLRKKLH